MSIAELEPSVSDVTLVNGSYDSEVNTATNIAQIPRSNMQTLGFTPPNDRILAQSGACGVLALRYQRGDESAFQDILEVTNRTGLEQTITSGKLRRHPKYVDPQVASVGFMIGVEEAARTWQPEQGSFLDFLVPFARRGIDREIRGEYGYMQRVGERRTRSMTQDLNDSGFSLAETIEDQGYSEEARLALKELPDRTNVFLDTELFPEKTLVDLIVRLRSGDTEALGTIFEHTKDIRRILTDRMQVHLPRYVHRMDIETAVDDAVTTVCERTFDLEHYCQKGALKKYFGSIPHWRRCRWLEQMYPQLRKRNNEEMNNIATDGYVNHNSPDPQNVLANREERIFIEKRVREIFDGLSDGERIVFRERLNGKGYKAIAKAIGVRRETCSRAFSRTTQTIIEGMTPDMIFLYTTQVKLAIYDYFSENPGPKRENYQEAKSA